MDGVGTEISYGSLAVVIELIGHAGAGKTWLMREVQADLLGMGVPCKAIDARGKLLRGWAPRRFLEVYSLIRKPRMAIRGVRFLVSGGHFAPREIGTLGNLLYRKLYLDEHAKSDAVYLVDEGLCHGIWSLTLRAKVTDRAALVRFLSSLSCPRYLVSLRPNLTEVLDGLARKEDYRHRLLDLQPGERIRRLEEQEMILDVLEAQVDRRGAVIRVDGPTRTSAREVAGWLRNLVLGGEPFA